MKDGAILINAARGEVVDTSALRQAVKNKKLRVALDVYEDEPGAADPEFADVELAGMVTCTPHIGASSKENLLRIGDLVVAKIKIYLEEK